MKNTPILLTAVLALGCSASTSATKDGGSSKGEAAVAATATCSTFPAATIVSTLSAADQEKACHEFAACDVQPYLANPVDVYCDMMGMLAVSFGGEDFSSDAEVRAACKSKKSDCLADPASVGKADQTVQSVLTRPCPTPVTCTWTMGKVEACWKAIRASTAGKSPTCETMTVAITKPKSNADAATLDPPSECHPLDDASCLLLSVGVTTR